MKHFPLYLLAAALTLTACRSSKHAVAGSDSGVTAATPAADSKKADAKAAAEKWLDSYDMTGIL